VYVYNNSNIKTNLKENIVPMALIWYNILLNQRFMCMSLILVFLNH